MFLIVIFENLVLTTLAASSSYSASYSASSSIDFNVNNLYRKTYNQSDIANLLASTLVAGDVKCLILCQTVECASLTYSPGTKQCTLYNGNPALVRYGTVSNYNIAYNFNTFLNVGESCLLDVQCIYQKCHNERCICLRDKSKFDYGLINEWTFNNTLMDSVQCNDLTNVGAFFNQEASKGYSILLNGGYLIAPTDYYFIGDFTVTCWFYQYVVNTASAHWSRLIDFGNANTNTPNNNILFALLNGPDTTPTLYLFDTNTGTTSSFSVAQNTGMGNWVHVAAILSGSTASMFINGTLSAGSTVTGFRKPAKILRTINYVGKSFNTADGATYARFINLRIYNRALSAAEIIKDMNNMTVL